MNMSNMAGINPMSIAAVLIGGALLFHFSSKEEVIMAILGVVVITYLTR